MIVKDDSEVELLRNSLISVIDHVDSVHVTSNGEKTAQIEALMGFTREKFPQKEIDYSHLKWNKDFSEQRNFNFSRASSDTDYIFWMDTDDLLYGAQHLRPLAETAKRNGKDVVFLNYWYGCKFKGKPSLETFEEVEIEHYRERLIRPGVITWKGRLHETPVPVDGQKDNYTKVPYDPEKNPIAVMHLASLIDAKEKMLRNKEILELQLKGEGDKPDPRTMLYLMKIYAEIGNKEDGLLEKCIEMGHEYLQLSGWDEERATACDLIAICSTKLGRLHEAITYLHQAISEYPFQPIHYVRLALAYFNVGRYRESKHWMELASKLEFDDQTAGIKNIKELKILFAQMLLKIKYNVDKDIKGAVEAAELLLKEQPIQENKENLLFMMDLLDLYEASEATKKQLEYLEAIGEKKSVIKVLETLPEPIAEQPWAINLRRQNSSPRIWEDNEICYFANFGAPHFEKWDGNSISKGIGGSETAVIRLAEEWSKNGYRVTVYGDPEKKCEINGVTYLPWYYFNKGDKFNIFIQWRNPSLSRQIKARRFYVDLHDVTAQVDYSMEIMNAIDGVFFKSEYHKAMLSQLPEEKKIVIGNGIEQ